MVGGAGRAGRCGRPASRRRSGRRGWQDRRVADGDRVVAIAGRIVTPTGVVEGWVDVGDDGRIAAVRPGRPPTSARRIDGATVMAGFVDLHVHGGGGHSVTNGEADAIRAASDFHLRHGTTTSLISLVTAPVDELVAAMGRITDLLDDGGQNARRLAGIHAEGPFLSADRCGAQDPESMTDPEPDLVAALLDAAGGHLRVMTLAPERRGALEAIGLLTANGVIAAIGHSDATYEQARAAIDAGATLATHLGNAMSPLGHRRPGVVGACLAAPDLTCELIVDGHHLHPGFVRLAAAAKGTSGVVLITDAMAAAGIGDGRYRLGRFDVDVVGGVARVADGSLAGSTLTMDRAVANAVAAGLDEVAVSWAASLNPARLLGIDHEVGSVEPGKRADVVVLDGDGEVAAVLVAGAIVHGSLDA